ncbi:hypothetical protein L873DRAFT_1817418 [Choiromyces venosus 120613-1]|uniref:Uncharacterized protein n=1 Tax=Choiromyces venosus 120613-1 TaxID=1336337 RepID=A0A3N4J5K2_9PEZI|nr:hypothetical protein L873DRAFT_1817418 [Choiromyces venosus 120613-1]
MCRLTLKVFVACNHRIWLRKEACCGALDDITYGYPACIFFPNTSTSFMEPPTEAVVETQLCARETCRSPNCKYTIKPDRIGGGL